MTPLRTSVAGREIEYHLNPSKRARRMSLSARPGVGLVATVPAEAAFPSVERFLERNARWVFSALQWLKRQEGHIFLPRSRREFVQRSAEARRLVGAALAKYGPAYDFRVGRISIRNQTSRWGSCSRAGNLSFNWKIVCLPPHLADYVVVHELCHLAAFDHSRKFWDLVERTIPDAKARRVALRAYHP